MTPGADPSALGLSSDDRCVVSSRLPLFYLSAALQRCKDGGLEDVRLWIDGPAPLPEQIGFRHRPWLSEIWASKPLPATWRPLPAPVRAVADIAAAIETLESPQGGFAGGPPVLQIQTATGCRATCPWCPIGPVSAEERTMSPQVWGALVAELTVRPAAMVELFFHAEPLLDTALETRSLELKRACPDTLLTIVTHELALTPPRAESLAASGLDVVFVSVNVPGRPSTQRLRRRLEPLVAMAAVLRAAGKALVLTTLGNFLKEGTRGRLRRLCRDLSLPCETFVATSRAGDVQVDRWTGGRHTSHSGMCPRPFFKAYVRVDGRLALCCEDWRYRVELGRIGDGETLQGLWQAPAYRDVRDGLLQHRELAEPCKRCDYRQLSK